MLCHNVATGLWGGDVCNNKLQTEQMSIYRNRTSERLKDLKSVFQLHLLMLFYDKSSSSGGISPVYEAKLL